jgi:putative nucleotidyltransferase with HDIG domain
MKCTVNGKISPYYWSKEIRLSRETLSEEVSAMIDHAGLSGDFVQAHNGLPKTLEEMTSALSEFVKSRDPYTAGHQKRVAELAGAIAAEMGLPEWRVKGLYTIGVLHDVGKIAIPPNILNKPGKLSREEFEIIKKHVRIGYEILSRVELPWLIGAAVLQHHERLDGSGYPAGLRDSEIILETRILSVADVVEAMSSHRPYRSALGVEIALNEIKQQSGVLYDGEVVDACFRLLNNDSVFEKLMSAASE